MATPWLRVRVVTEAGDVLVDELVGVGDDIAAFAERHAKTALAARDRGERTVLIVEDPDGVVPTVVIGEM